MSRNKRQKFAEFKQLPHALSFPDHLAGRWGEDVFGNNHPLTVELACGHGVFLVAMARRYPQRNFIGMDIKSARLWAGATAAANEELDNVRFVRAEIEQLGRYVAPREINEIWVTFPDPFPKKRTAKKRLTAPRFLALYETALAAGGLLHLKTDDRALFEYSLETVADAGAWQLQTLIDNVHADAASAHALDLDIISRYEELHLQNGKRICYTRWKKTH